MEKSPVIAENDKDNDWLKNFNEDTQAVQRDVRHIKDWLEKQPHLPSEIDDKFLLNFFRGCKYSVERTKKKLDTYYSLRAAIPEFFSNRDPLNDDFKRMRAIEFAGPLPELTPEGYQVTVAGLKECDVKDFDFDVAAKHLFTSIDVSLLTEGKRAGDIVIFYMKGVKLGHIGKLSMTHIKKFLACVQGAYPRRVKEVHIVESPSYVTRFVQLFKPLLKEKLRKRIHIYSNDYTKLYKYLPRKILPSDLGGCSFTGPELGDRWLDVIQENRDWLLKQEHLKTDESKRQGKKKKYEFDSLLGNFKNLSLD